MNSYPLKLKLSPTVQEESLSSFQTSIRYEPDFEESKLWGSKRLVVMIFIFFGFVYHYMLIGNLSIAIIEITSNKTIVIGNQTINQVSALSWDSKTKGWMLSIFFYGYLFSFLGGYLRRKIGRGTVYGLSIKMTAFLTVLSPFAIRTNLYLFAAGRFAEGLFESFSYATACDVWTRWIPKHELPLMVAFTQTGIYIGASITLPLCGYIAQYWGWTRIFCLTGTFGLIWCIAYYAVVKNDPSLHPNISQRELHYIRHNVGCKDITIEITYPWRKIFISKPLWALCAGKFAFGWAFSFMTICMPLYVKDITGKNTAEVGVLSGIPSYTCMIMCPIVGVVTYYLQNKFGFADTKVHKWMISTGFFIGGILFMIVCFTDFKGSLIFFVLISSLLSTSIIVLQLVIVHIAPDHAEIVAGISAFWYNLGSLGNPLSIGYIIADHTWQQWSKCFILTGVILIIGALITALFGSSDNQNWSSIEYQKPKISQKTENIPTVR